MYFPPFEINQPIANGTMNINAALDLSNAFQFFFNNFNASVTIADTACVASDAGQVVRPITSVQVGTIFDTQRRRRDNLIEQYYTSVVTP